MSHFKQFTFVRQYFRGANVNTSYSGWNKKGAVEEGASVAHEFQWPPHYPKNATLQTKLVNKSWWLSRPKSWRKCPFQLTEINSEITRRGEFKSDLIVLGGVLNDALGWVDLRCVVRLPRTPVLLPCPRQFSGRSRGSIRTPGANARRFPVADHCHSSL